MKKMQLIIKRFFDLLFALILLVLLIPLFVAVSIIIKLESKGPVLFIHERIGKNQKRFKVYKFRSMIDSAINIGMGIKTKEGDPRITKTGKYIRKTSIDELPQLINILKGEMSFIGPRPAIDVHLKHYTPIGYCRFNLRPGLSGLAQINGRGNITVKKRLVYDVCYVLNYSLMLDLKILCKTFYVVFAGVNVYRKQHADMKQLSSF